MAEHLRRGGTVRVHWINQYAVPPDQPGGTRHHEMALALRTRGWDVRVVASDLNLASRTYSRRADATDTRAIEEGVSGVPFIWLPAGDYQRNDWRRASSMMVFAWHVLRYLLRTVRRGDVVIGSSPQLLAAAAARVAAFVRGARFVLEVRDLWPESLTGVTGHGGVMAVGLRIIADALYRTSRAIVILAQGSRGPIERHGGRPARIVYIPNGVDMAGLDREGGEVPEALAWVESVPTFVYAGAHGPANGLDLVLEAAHELDQLERGDIRILLVGDGSVKIDLQREAIRARLSNVVFHDPVPKHVIPALLRGCTGGLMVLKNVDLFSYGVSPNKLFDYLACDLPVVTNVEGEVATIVDRANAGVVVPPDDARALARAMIAITDGEIGPGDGPAYIRAHHDRGLLADRLAHVLRVIAR